MSPAPFTLRAIELIRSIPEGKVATYGQIAAMAGSPRAARQVVRVLHSSSRKEGLPWHRVVNREGKISLPEHRGHNRQRALLKSESIEFGEDDRINLDRYRWRPDE